MRIQAQIEYSNMIGIERDDIQQQIKRELGRKIADKIMEEFGDNIETINTDPGNPYGMIQARLQIDINEPIQPYTPGDIIGDIIPGTYEEEIIFE